MNAMAVARLLGGKVQGDSEMPVTGVSDIAHAKEGDVTFVQTPALAVAASKSAASVVLVAPGLEVPGKTVVEVKNPKYAFVRLLAALGPREETPAGVDERAFVDPSAELARACGSGGGALIEAGARLGAGAQVFPGGRVGRGCVLGEGAVLHRNAVLYPGTILGARTVIHAGAVIGADGFGYLQEGKDIEAATGKAIERYMQTDEPHLKVPHFGNVVLGDDVEIGANATIDRGTTGSTVLGKGTKIDNLVQIGHNCSIGEHVLLVGMVGVGGSVTLGDHVTVGGNTGISEGVTLGRFCIVGAHTLIYPGKKFPERTVIWGNPARPAGKIRAQLAALATLPRIVVRMGDLEKRVKAFEDETRGGDRCN